MTITIDQFNEVLRNQPFKLENQLIKGMKETGFQLEEQAKENATTYPRVYTGRLRNSIQTDSIKMGDGFGIRLRAGGQGIKGIGNNPPADVNYAAKIEFGDGQIAPRLFLRRAMDQIIKTKFQDMIDRVLARSFE